MTAIYVILISIVTDMVPYFSVLELKFIDIFSHTAVKKKKKSRFMSSSDSNPEPSQASKSPLISGLEPKKESRITANNGLNMTHNDNSSGESNPHNATSILT